MSLPLFAGPFARFGRTLLTADDARPLMTLPDLLRPERLDQLLLSVYGPQLMPDQLPVLVSQWAKFYFMQLIPPVLVASLVHDWHWPLQLGQVALALDERGVPSGVRLAGRDASGEVCRLIRFSALPGCSMTICSPSLLL